MQRGAIILCGGQSSRMGADKALLPFGGETMLERTVRIVSSAVEPSQVVVVAGTEQVIPNLGAVIARDETQHKGPLLAIARGVEALPSPADVVFVTGCDTPLLRPEVIDYLFRQVADFDCVVPQDAERQHPLCAIYRSSVSCQIADSGHGSLHRLIERLRVKLIACDDLRAVDPDLYSLLNVNTRQDYQRALEIAGLSTP